MPKRTWASFIAIASVITCVMFLAGRAPRGFAAAPPTAESYDWNKWREFWSFKPVKRPDVPVVKDASWSRNEIDRFILAKVEAEKLPHAAEADRLTLLRRVTFDLTGLPPTPEEIRAFEHDKSRDAYEKVVDRLLASPHYGEHWGRHWLDVARYVPGRINFPGVKNTSGDSGYRDYVVRAFNQDKPYDEFLTEQLAGDLLPESADRQKQFDQIIAPAFLSIGAWFDQCTDPNRLKLEMVDEMIGATSNAFLGLSVQCARCHDHKFDPIPTADYYAMAGIFRSTRIVGDFSEYWRDGRVRQLRPLATPDEVAANDRARKEIDAKQASLWSLLSKRHAELLAQWKLDEPKYRAAASEIPTPFVKLFEAENFDGRDNLRIAQLSRDGIGIDVIETQTPLKQWVKYKFEVPKTANYRLEALYSAGEPALVSLQVNGKTAAADALNEATGSWDLYHQRWQSFGEPFELHRGLNFLRINTVEGNFPRLDRFRLVEATDATDAAVIKSAADRKLQPKLLANFIADPDRPWPTIADTVDYLDDADRNEIDRLNTGISEAEQAIKPYPLVVSVMDQPETADLPVHVKGDTYQTAGDPIPRGVPQLLDTAISHPAIPPHHSGRLELARWMTDSENPLVARVMVNRIWHWHFGRGIVATPSDFGSRGAAPTNPELLNWLASELVKNHWSIKQMHRMIVTSSTYRMSSAPSDASTASDPDNRLLSHFSRKRLEAESIYDAMRSTTNMIPRQESGHPLDVSKSGQRAMYLLSNGKAPQGLGGEVRKFFPLFDFEMTGVPLPARPTSSTPAQSLFFLNNPLPKYLADRFAERLLRMDKLTDAKRVEMAYLLALGRPPSEAMTAQSLAFIEQSQSEAGGTAQEAWAKLCRALYATAEFRYVE